MGSLKSDRGTSTVHLCIDMQCYLHRVDLGGVRGRRRVDVRFEWTMMLGLGAAALTSLSYIPQARKALPRGSTDDISLKMLLALGAGLFLWILYGLAIKDFVIVIANTVGLGLVGFVLACKIRDLRKAPDFVHNPASRPARNNENSRRQRVR